MATTVMQLLLNMGTAEIFTQNASTPGHQLVQPATEEGLMEGTSPTHSVFMGGK
jgi:hypothetical protein